MDGIKDAFFKTLQMDVSIKKVYMFSRNSVGDGVGSGTEAGLRGEVGAGEPSRFLWKGLRV